MNNKGLFACFCVILVGYLALVSALIHVNLRAFEQSVVSENSAPLTELSASPANAVFLDNDSYMWVLYAEQGLQQGTWRVRHTALDNTTAGREVHWCSGPLWFMEFWGTVLSKVTKNPLRSCLETVAYWWSPLVHLTLVISATGLVWRRLGPKGGVLTGLLLVTLPGLHWLCGTARPGHHCLQVLFVFSSCLLPYLGGMGWVRGNMSSANGFLLNHAQARRWFVAAGLAGAAGLWSGALIQSAVFMGFGVGVAVGLVLPKPDADDDDALYEPSLWRWWGWSGAAGSLLLYAVEYAPAEFGMNLEVNHPWYALCFASGGECLYRLGCLRRGTLPPARQLVWMLLAGLVTVSLPMAVWLGPAQWHALRDPLMQRMHDAISEFMPFASVYGTGAWLRFWTTIGLLPLALPGAAYCLSRSDLSPRKRAGLSMALGVSLLLLGAMLLQNRWEGFFALSTVLLALILWEATSNVVQRSNIWYWALIAQTLLIAGLIPYVIQKYGSAPESIDIAFGIVSKRTDLQWRALRKDQPWRILAEPAAAPSLEYFTGASTVTSFYWENLSGLRDATVFMTDQGDEEARRIARERQLTHVVLSETPEAAKFYQHVRFGQEDLKLAKNSLAGRLSRRQPPSWLRLDEKMTDIARTKYRKGDVQISHKYLVYDVDQMALNGKTE